MVCDLKASLEDEKGIRYNVVPINELTVWKKQFLTLLAVIVFWIESYRCREARELAAR